MKRKLTWILTAIALTGSCVRDRPPVFNEPPAGTYTTATRHVRLGDSVASVPGATVTLDFFKAAEAPPIIGRYFVKGEEMVDAAAVVVLSYDFWRERFESSPAVIGRMVNLDGWPHTVVGIAPRGFNFPEGTRVWTPRN